MSHPILSHVEQECQESLIQESFTFNKIGAKAWSIQKSEILESFVIQTYPAYILLIIWP